MNAVAARLTGVRPRVATAGVLALVVLAALPFVGRWEERSNAATQNARMAAIYRLATSDGLTSKWLFGYRLDWTFDCLVYTPPKDPAATNALELCFDPQGRLVQTIDRRTSTPHFASLLEQPSLATLRVPVPKLLAALAAVQAFRDDPRLIGTSLHRGTLPVRFNDIGASHFAPMRRSPGR